MFPALFGSGHHSSGGVVGSFQHALALLATLLVAATVAGCDSTGSQDDSVRLRIQASDQLRQIIRNPDRDFTWELFQQEVVVMEEEGDRLSEAQELRLRLLAVPVLGTESGREVLGPQESVPMDVSGDELVDGVRVGQFTGSGGSGAVLAVANEHFSLGEYAAIEAYADSTTPPDTYRDVTKHSGPRPFVDAVLANADVTLKPEDGVLVLYLLPAGDEKNLDAVRPLGMFVERCEEGGQRCY